MHKTSSHLLLALCSTGLLLSGCAQKTINTDTATLSSYMKESLDTFPMEGASLPYTVLRDDLNDNSTDEPLEIRNGGYGSAMTAHPTNKGQFYAMTDRGPNAKFKGALGKGKIFPLPYYTPRIGLFELQKYGVIRQIKTITLKRPDGSRITGLPNDSALGGTGETPYNVFGQPITVDSSKAYNVHSNPIKLDNYGLDGEGLAALKDGSFWVSDEYGPHIVHFDADGKEIGRINPFRNDSRSKIKLPAEFANRRPNRGMEGLAITPDQTTLVGIMQSTMYNPSKSVKNSNITRIVSINLKTQEIKQYLYKQDKNQNANSEITALDDGSFLVIERDGSFLQGGSKPANPKAQKKIYRISLNSGTNLETVSETDAIKQDKQLGLTINGMTLEEVVTSFGWDGLKTNNITPVAKTEIADLVKLVDYPHDKMEGLWVIDDHHIGVLNDDDFAMWSKKGFLEQKKINKNTVDSNRLYILNIPLKK